MSFLKDSNDFKWLTGEVKDRIIKWQFANGVKMTDTDRAFADLCFYGEDILKSEVFASAFEQVHHHISTVGEHTLHVALKALSIAYDFQDKGISVNIESVVCAALCHDLGILGRHEKFKNNLVCCFKHPIHSADIAKESFPFISYEAYKAIARHMFPATPIPPTTLTGLILIWADKSSSVNEVRGIIDSLDVVPA